LPRLALAGLDTGDEYARAVGGADDLRTVDDQRAAGFDGDPVESGRDRAGDRDGADGRQIDPAFLAGLTELDQDPAAPLGAELAAAAEQCVGPSCASTPSTTPPRTTVA
jgi:hypothetical protein